MEIELKVTRDRVLDLVTIEELIGLQNGDMAVIVEVLARFVYRDGTYLAPEEGKALCLKMTGRQLLQSAEVFQGRAEEAIVPLGNGSGSVLPSNTTHPPRRSGSKR